MPTGPGVRVDTAVAAGERIAPHYDPMIAKVMTVGADRGVAIDRMRRALDEIIITGIQTTLPFDRALVRDAAFLAGKVSTDFVTEHWDTINERFPSNSIVRLLEGVRGLSQPDVAKARATLAAMMPFILPASACADASSAQERQG